MFIGVPIAASGAEEDSDWQFSLTPYLWLPSIQGTLNYELPPGDGGNPAFDIGPTDWLDLLNVGALVSASARKGRFSITTDAVYLSMTRNSDGRIVSIEDTISGPGGIEIPVGASLTAGSRTDFEGLQWGIFGGFEFYRSGSSHADVFAGARYFGVDVTTAWNLTAAITTPGGTEVFPASGSIGANVDLWDAIAGVRGEFGLGESRWSMPYSVDIGTGDSDLTWNAVLGLAYRYGWGDLGFFYRHLYYDMGSDGLLQGFSFGGPAFGARFNF